MAEKYAVVRASRSIPGGLRIVGSPTHDKDQAQRSAASYRTPHEVLPLSEVYQRRADALEGREDSHDG